MQSCSSLSRAFLYRHHVFGLENGICAPVRMSLNTLATDNNEYCYGTVMDGANDRVIAKPTLLGNQS